MSAIRIEELPSLVSAKIVNDSCLSEIENEASLPPRHAADHLVEVYFQYRTPHLPIIDRSQVNKALENAYISKDNDQPLNKSADKDKFIAYIVFAIALCDVSNASGGRPAQSQGCFRSAISFIENLITYSESDVETLRCVLLLAQFVALCPSWGSLWHLTGTALRLCIDIGLHWESEEQAINMDPKLLHDRRCLWYSTYQLDRSLCITLGRPLGIIDESTQVQLPNPWAVSRQPLISDSYNFDIHNQRAHNHMFTLSKLESEIRHVLHSHQWPLKLAYPRVNYSAWLQDIQPRLQEWYNTVPQPTKAHPSSIFACQAYWDGVYNNAILLLYRPNSIISHSVTEVSISFDASCKLITSIKALQREGKIDIMWKWVHHLFMAGLTVIYSVWHSKEVRDQKPVRNIIFSLQSCASTLFAMSETFPGASGCRDAFDTLSSATTDWLVTNDAEEIRQTPLGFEEQVKCVLSGLQQFRRNMGTAAENSTANMTSILSTDNSTLCEMLNSAAQWPDCQYMDFRDMVPL
ncbi:c6 transcription factor protein [Penicillium lividum]|nr:c6 transcription factor protein [Penicillium lividum]